MATPFYTTDLTDVNLAESTTGWTEPSGATTGGTPTAQTDFFIQGSFCISKTANGTGLLGLGFTPGSEQAITSPAAVYVWLLVAGVASLDTQANGGLQVIVGSSSANYKKWYVRGKDTYTYGGWLCIPVDPTVTQDATQGTPTSTLQYFGGIIKNLAAVAGHGFGVDAIRFGRTLQAINGETGNFATFAGAATENDITTNRWGIFQAVDGGYLLQGLLLLGTSGSLVDFRDSNASILIAKTEKVASGFNKVEVRNSSSRIDWTNVSITTLGTTSRGDFVTTDNADINFDGCVFTDMGTFDFLSNGTILNSTFRRCNLVTQGSAIFTECTFDSTNDGAKALLSNDPSKISNCKFISGGTKHAIEISTAGTYTFSANTFTGYGIGGTTDAAVYNNSGGAVTLNITDGGDTPTIRNGTGATTTVNNSVTLEINGVVQGAQCYIEAGLGGSETAGTVLMNEQADVNGIAQQSYSFISNQPVRIRARLAGYLPFATTGTVTSSGLTVTVVWLTDSNYTP